MASITRIENKKGPSYKIRVSCGYDLKGKKVAKTFTFQPDSSLTVKQQEKEAQKHADEIERKIKDGINLDGKKISFEQFATDWLERRRDSLTFNTYKCYEMHLRTKLFPAFGTMKIADIKLPMIEDFLRTLIRTSSQSTITKYKIILNRIFKDCIRYNMIDKNPCDSIELPKSKVKNEGLKFFTPDQVQTFLNSLDMEFEFTVKGHERIDDTGKQYSVGNYVERHTIPSQLKVFYHIAVFCGMRKGEILALTWNDIDFEKKIIIISKSAAKTPNGVECKTPKTSTSVRKIPLPDPIIPLLKRYKCEYDIYRLSLGDKWQGYGNLFIQPDGKLMGIDTAYQRFKRHIEQYNKWVGQANKELPKGSPKIEPLPEIPLHGLRHSCATWLNHLEVNILVISKILGHAQVSTTMNIYAHGFQDQLREASDKINKDWNARTGKSSEQRAAI